MGQSEIGFQALLQAKFKRPCLCASLKHSVAVYWLAQYVCPFCGASKYERLNILNIVLQQGLCEADFLYTLKIKVQYWYLWLRMNHVNFPFDKMLYIEEKRVFRLLKCSLYLNWLF